MTKTIEYRVRPVTRYIVTRYEQEVSDSDSTRDGASSRHGEFENFEIAYEVGYALCKAEHERLGWPLGDPRIQYPRQIIRSGEIVASPQTPAVAGCTALATGTLR